jgi:hypothetical protein
MSDECETPRTSICTVPADQRDGWDGVADGRVATVPAPPNRPRHAEGRGNGEPSASASFTRIRRQTVPTCVQEQIPRGRSVPDMAETDFSGSGHPPPRSLFLEKER